MTIRELRESIQTHLSTITELPDVVCFIERDGTDQEEALDTQLRTKGLAIVVQSMAGSVGSQSQAGRLAKMDLAIPVAVLENPTANLGAGGSGVPAENAVEIIARKLIGKETEFGTLSIGNDSFGRVDEGDGVIVYYFAVMAPWIMRGTA